MKTTMTLGKALAAAGAMGWLWTAVAVPAWAAEELARLTVELRVDGAERRGPADGGDYAEGEFHDFYRFTFTTRSEGDLNEVNMKDPESLAQAVDRGTALQQRIQATQPPPAAAPAPAVAAVSPEELEARALAGQEACQEDMACLMKLAQELSAQTMAMQGQGYAAPTPAAGAWEDGEDAEPDLRYLEYYPYYGCESDARITIDRKVTGAYSDIQGLVPYSVTRTADHRADADMRQFVCFLGGVVVDVKTDTFYTDGLSALDAPGTEVRQYRGRPTETREMPMTLQGDIAEWMQAELRKAPLSGRRDTTITLTRDQSGAFPVGDYSGSAEVELTWRFERL